IAKIDLSSQGRWVDRKGIYEGSGLYWTTIAPGTLQPTHRVLSNRTFGGVLCTRFSSVHVDSEALLKAVGSDHKNLRSLEAIGDSPMRSTPGCEGCHAPMDGPAGF